VGYPLFGARCAPEEVLMRTLLVLLLAGAVIAGCAGDAPEGAPAPKATDAGVVDVSAAEASTASVDAEDGATSTAPDASSRDASQDAASPPADAKDDGGAYRIGASKQDITGPFVGSSTGYNSPGDQMSGLGMRLYARSFVIEEPGSGQLVALVTADMIHMYQSVKVGVIKQLAARGLGGVFRAENVVLSATHTHSAPSNISWYTLFNLFNGVVGFDAAHYQLVVDGIATSIERAHAARVPARIKLARGRVADAGFNRSLPAYQANQDVSQFERDIDDTMTLLRFDALDGTPLGLINWFGVHGTSLGIDNRREHGDNKGWAAYTLERQKGGGFVAAFAQGSFGDVSPNHPDPSDRKAAFKRPVELDPALDPIENPIVHGRVQLQQALALYAAAENAPAQPLSLGVRHTHVDFNQVSVRREAVRFSLPWDDASRASTCPAVIGGGFLAGDEEGAPVALAEEGAIRNRFVAEGAGYRMEKYSFLELKGAEAALGLLWPLAVLTLQTDQYDACQKEKFALLPVGKVDHFWLFNPSVPLVPVILPFQLVRVGELSLVALPFEVSTMAGRRIRKATAQALGVSDEQLAIAGMANAYGQYLTTREEYAAQHFEGAFTIYGPWSQAAVEQTMAQLAGDLAAGRASERGPEPPDLSTQQLISTPISDQGVPVDVPGTAGFGHVLSDVQPVVARSAGRVSATFQAAHPRSIQELRARGELTRYYPGEHTYLRVERKQSGGFATVADDGDPYTTFDWKLSASGGGSEATVSWLLRDQPAGTYRIRYFGLAKQAAGMYQAFEGTSAEFELR
jgi:neutral ceramidase